MEQNEVEKITCPCCKSKTTARYEDRIDNGIIGNGYASQVKQSYNICMDCGILFKDKVQLSVYRKRLLPLNQHSNK